jgi:hypothetical protein
MRDNGSPCLKPQELLKKPDGVSRTNTKKRTEEIQKAIKLHHFSQTRISSANTIKSPN